MNEVDLEEGHGMPRWLALVAFAVVAALPALSHAECTADCSTAYESAMSACQSTNPDPNSPNALQSCMDQAQQDFAACTAACTESENDEQG